MDEYSNQDVTPFQTYYEWDNQVATAYVGKTAGHGATYGYYNSRFGTVAVHKNLSNIPYIPFGTIVDLTPSLALPYEGGTMYKSSFTFTDTGPGVHFMGIRFSLSQIATKRP